MKKNKNFYALICLLIISLHVNSQDKSPSLSELKIKTSAICNMCKETIEKHLAFEKGVKRSDLDVESKILTVYYNPKKTSPEKIRSAVSRSGYDADDIPANQKAYNKLDGCCKKGAVCNDK